MSLQLIQLRNVGDLGQGGTHGWQGLDSRCSPKIEQQNYLVDWTGSLKEREWLRMCARFHSPNMGLRIRRKKTGR